MNELMNKLIKRYMKVGYRNLHLHTDSSHLDGMNDIPSLVKRLKEINHDACAVTDHGVAHNLLSFYKAGLENKFKPILGIEFYNPVNRKLTQKSEFIAYEDATGDDLIWRNYHLIVLAKNIEGYRNLCRLAHKSYDSFYSKPRIDFHLLKEYSKGLVVIEGHVGTQIAALFEKANNPISKTQSMVDEDDLKKFPQLLDVIEKEKEEYCRKKIDRAYAINQRYKDLFGDDYYLEIQNHGLEIEKIVTPMVIKLAKDSGVKLVMTNDSHYTWRSDAEPHRVHMSNGLKKFYEDFMDGFFEGFSTCEEFYVKSDEEMLEMAMPFGEEAIQALINTHEIVDKCNVDIEQLVHKESIEIDKDSREEKVVHKWSPANYLFPKFDIPLPFKDTESYFDHLVAKGFEERKKYISFDEHPLSEYLNRLEYEKGIIKKMGFPTYFLILWDLIRFCKEKDIPVGPGRG